jgi:glycosyltransferase involved in cell wall biosynthesis
MHTIDHEPKRGGPPAPHVALFVPSLRGGGAEKAWVNLAVGLLDKGVRVDLILMEKDGPYLARVPPEVRIIDLEDPSNSLASVPRLRRYLRKEKPDALLVALKKACMVSLVAKRLAGGRTRVVTTLHGVLWEDDKLFKYKLGRRIIYPWADEIVAVSSGAADDFARFSWLPRGRMKVIYNPIVSPELTRRAREEVDHPWFKPGGPPVVISVGRLIREKDFGTLIRAFALVRKRREARLVILGEGPEREGIEALIGELGLRESAAALGFVENPYAYVARAALFAMSSTTEGLPNVLVEALAVGTPIVSTDCVSGPREILDGGRYGTLVPVGDVEALADALDTQLGARHDRQSLLARAGDFTIEKITEQYLAVSGITL